MTTTATQSPLQPMLTCRFHPATGLLTAVPHLPTPARRPAAGAPTEDSRARAFQEAARRARQTVTELAADNDLVYLWTLTYAQKPQDEDLYTRAYRDLRLFRQRLRRAGAVMQMVAVPEVSSAGRLHIHLATNVFSAHEIVGAAWALGAVQAPREAREPGVVAHYLTKDFHSGPRRMRYSATRGLQRVVDRFPASDLEAALARCADVHGCVEVLLAYEKGTTKVLVLGTPESAPVEGLEAGHV